MRRLRLRQRLQQTHSSTAAASSHLRLRLRAALARSLYFRCRAPLMHLKHLADQRAWAWACRTTSWRRARHAQRAAWPGALHQKHRARLRLHPQLS